MFVLIKITQIYCFMAVDFKFNKIYLKQSIKHKWHEIRIIAVIFQVINIHTSSHYEKLAVVENTVVFLTNICRKIKSYVDIEALKFDSW